MESLEDVVEGDILVHSNLSRRYMVQVTHTTKTQIHIGDLKFRRESGDLIGSTCMWDLRMLAIPKEGELDSLLSEERRRILLHKLSLLSLDQLPDKGIKEVLEIAEKYKQD